MTIDTHPGGTTVPQDSKNPPRNTSPRIALFGGSFDPPHRGHLAIAAVAAEAFALTKVLFAPTARQPLKPAGALASFADRLAMVTLACAAPSETSDPPRFQPSALDAPRPDHRPNYTVDTLTQLRHEHPEAELFAIAGADSFLDLPRWHEAPHLFDLAQWIVVSRPDFPLDNLAALGLTPAQRARTYLLETVHEPISATELRTRLAAGDPCPGLLPEAVTAYIQRHHLYRGHAPAQTPQP